jgi:Ankyrin repeats (3 copies)
MASTLIGKQAVVIGAGMAGLTAAGALADRFDQVVVLERDTLPSEPRYRAGTPQSRHVHALLLSGQRALSELFPGFEQDLAQAEPCHSGSVSMFAWSARATIPSRNATLAGSVTPCHDRQSSAPCDGGWKAARTPRCASAAGFGKCWRRQVEGRSPACAMRTATARGSNVIAKLLLDRGANIDARDFLGATPLQYASLHGQKSVVELLTTRGATVNAQSSFGKTALHLAAAAGNKEVVKVLLAHGAGLTVRNSDHQTPLQELQASSLDTATKTNIAALLNAPRNTTARDGSQTARQNPLRSPVNPQASTPNALPACTDLAGIAALVSRANPGIDPRVLVSAVEQYQVTMGCRQPPPTVALPPPSPPPPPPTTTNCTTSGYDSGGIVNRTTNCTTR